MTATPLPTLILPNPQGTTRPADNNNAIIRYTKTVSPRMYAVDGYIYSITGAPPPIPPSDVFMMIAGYQVVAFSGGSGTLTFPQTIPNGLVSFVGVSTAGDAVGYSAFSPTTVTVAITGASTGVGISYQAIVW